ncbi:hypothetical protein DSECCO2_284340 [anaerobic digester metagenome]
MRNLLTVVVLSLVFSFLTVSPAFCNDPIANEDQMNRSAAEKVWNQRQRRSLNIEQVNVDEGKIEVVIEEIHLESKTEIQNTAYPFEVEFVNLENQGRDNYIRGKNFAFTEGKNILFSAAGVYTISSVRVIM